MQDSIKASDPIAPFRVPVDWSVFGLVESLVAPPMRRIESFDDARGRDGGGISGLVQPQRVVDTEGMAVGEVAGICRNRLGKLRPFARHIRACWIESGRRLAYP